jgi:hypothetical protein
MWIRRIQAIEMEEITQDATAHLIVNRLLEFKNTKYAIVCFLANNVHDIQQ